MEFQAIGSKHATQSNIDNVSNGALIGESIAPNVTVSHQDKTLERSEDDSTSVGFVPSLIKARLITPDDLDTAEAELSNLISDDVEAKSIDDLKAEFNDTIDTFPEDEQLFWKAILEMAGGADGMLGEGFSRGDQSAMVLLLNLLIILAKASSEMKKTQRNASFSEMKQSVSHLVDQAKNMKEGANFRFALGMLASGVSMGASFGGAFYIRNIAMTKDGHDVLSHTQFANMAHQVGSQTGEISSKTGEFINTTKDAQGRIDASESQKDSFESEQLKDLGGTTREVMSSALSNVREAINAYRSALDHTSANIA